MRSDRPTALALLLFCAAACAREDVTVYSVPRSEEATAPAGHDRVGRDLLWDTPKGWREMPGSGMRQATLSAGEGAGRVEVSVIAMHGEAGGLLANVNRWRGQIGLGPVGAEGLGELVRTVRCAAGEARVVELLGKRDGILAAVLETGGRTWFFKLRGSRRSVREAGPAFRGLVASLRPGRR